ncbi:hypothetical protein M6G53_00830 [Serratia nevei]|uniref:hypothetical protein n=1 Tax=Serratia nevei TaxID=2703794 RepID=UPI00209DC143|nr:hypothetical protein [Serratia nevei]MCP1103939.1 hypothetical protein [Serratia nevei]
MIFTEGINAVMLFITAVTERAEEKSNFLLGGESAFLFFLFNFTGETVPWKNQILTDG